MKFFGTSLHDSENSWINEFNITREYLTMFVLPTPDRLNILVREKRSLPTNEYIRDEINDKREEFPNGKECVSIYQRNIAY